MLALNNLEHHINDLLSKSFFPRYKNQFSYLAKFSKFCNEKEKVLHKWVKSDLTYNPSNEDHTNQNTLLQKSDDEQLEGSGFVFRFIVDINSERYEINDIQASSYIELPENIRIINQL